MKLSRQWFKVEVFCVVTRISGPKREDVARGWRRLHGEELHNLYASPNIVTVMKSRRVRFVGNLTRMV
jgi:hypothetical protein